MFTVDKLMAKLLRRQCRRCGVPAHNKVQHNGYTTYSCDEHLWVEGYKYFPAPLVQTVSE